MLHLRKGAQYNILHILIISTALNDTSYPACIITQDVYMCTRRLHLPILHVEISYYFGTYLTLFGCFINVYRVVLNWKGALLPAYYTLVYTCTVCYVAQNVGPP